MKPPPDSPGPTPRPPGTDEQSAVWIREEGRRRIEARRDADLGHWLAALPDLPARRASLDAAIDIALRWRSGSSKPGGRHVDALVADFPDFEDAIRDAAALANAMLSTHEIGLTATDDDEPSRALPAAFGPDVPGVGPRFELLELVGRGAAGEVYRAVDRSLSEDDRPAFVAVKILRSRRDDAASRERFAEEAARARRIDNPNVVRVYDRGQAPTGETYIVQELVGGGDLHARQRDQRTRNDARTAARLVVNVAHAIQAAHSAGLVHLDLKPANILLTERGEPKVTDFGLAMRHDVAPPADYRAATGTIGFMAPEQFLGEEGAAAPAADVYALGGILHWLLTGELPNGDRYSEIAATHKAGFPREDHLRRARREGRIDDDLAAICLRALQPDRARRCPTAGELAADLESWLRREPIRWRNPGALRVATLFARRRPAVAALALGLAVTLLGAVVALEAARRFAVDAKTKEAVALRFEAQARARELDALRFETEARAQQAEARHQAEKREAEQQYKADSAQSMLNFLRIFGNVSRSGLAGEVLTALWILEWVHGPVVFKNLDSLDEVWRERVATVRGILEDRRSEGRGADLMTLQLETVLAFWLIKLGEFQEPETLLAAVTTHWEGRLDADDPWLDDLALLQQCAAANRLKAQAAADGAASADILAECASLEPPLKAHYTRLEHRDDGAQLRRLAMEALYKIYSPGLLDTEEGRRWAAEQANAVDLSVPDM